MRCCLAYCTGLRLPPPARADKCLVLLSVYAISAVGSVPLQLSVQLASSIEPQEPSGFDGGVSGG